MTAIAGLLVQLAAVIYCAVVTYGETFDDAKWKTRRWPVVFSLFVVATLLQIAAAL